MSEETNVQEVTNEELFITVPAKIEVKIGKRTRRFDTIEDAKAALERFNAGPKTQNKGIQEARKKAKAAKEEFEAPIVAYLEGKGYTGRSLKQRTSCIAEYLADQQALCSEDVAVEGSCYDDVSDAPDEASIDPLSDLL